MLRVRDDFAMTGERPPPVASVVAAGGRRVGAVAGDDGPIGGGEVEGGERAGCYPAERKVLEGGGGRATGSEAADERKHLDDDAGVVVEERFERAGDRDGAAEFFGEFAVKGGGGGFGGFDFAAGKFPKKSEVFVGRALGDENAAGAVFDDRAHDGDRRAVGG